MARVEKRKPNRYLRTRSNSDTSSLQPVSLLGEGYDVNQITTSLRSYRVNRSTGTDTMEQEHIIYSLNIEDVQTVASEILDRPLSTNEIAIVKLLYKLEVWIL